MIVWHLKYCPQEDWLMELVVGKLPVRGTSSSICLPVSACSWASNNPNFLWKQHVFIRECYGPKVEIYRPDTVQFFAENIWHPARLHISQTSVGLAINCFLWDKIQAPLPSVENHLMEGVVTLRPICSHNWLTALPPSLCLSLFLYLPFYHSNPLLCGLFRSNWSCKPPWFSINFRNSTSHCCLPICQSSKHPPLEGEEAESIRDINWEHSTFTCKSE